MITMYGTPTCQNCDAIKKFLEKEDVSYTYKEVGKDILIEELELVVGRRVTTVPVITYNQDEVSFDKLKEEVSEARKRLEEKEQMEESLSDLRI